MFVCVGVGGEEACMTDYLTGTDQKIPLVRITFLEKVVTAVRFGIKS